MAQTAPRGPWNVLVVEDNPGDVRFIQQSFRGVGPDIRLHVVSDGDEALRFLRHEEGIGPTPRPDLVLLDLNLPLVDGREVLATMKKDPSLRCIPVVVLSGSTNQDDVRRAYELRANSYVSKPMSLARFREIARSIASFWLETTCLPS